MEFKTGGRAAGAGAWVGAALTAWALLVACVCIRGFLQPRDHNCYADFYEPAGRLWRAGQDPCLGTGGAYRYSPPVSVCLAPLTLTPSWLGSLLWRLVNAAAFLGALVWWLRVYGPPTWPPVFHALLLLGVTPLAAGNINNAQANLLLIGLMVATAAAAGRGLWGLAAVFCAAACCLKAYPVALALLLAVVYPRRFAWRFLIALGVAGAVPFLFQDCGSAARLYEGWWAVVRADDRTQSAVILGYRDLWLLIRNSGLPVNHTAYVGVQLLVAAWIAAVCLTGRWLRGWSPAEVVNACLHLGVCWMTLCGPATETSTYVLAAPTLTWALLDGWQRPWPPATRGLVLAAAAVLTAGQVGCLMRDTGAWTVIGFHPLAALLLLTALGAEYVRRLAVPAAALEGQGVKARAA